MESEHMNITQTEELEAAFELLENTEQNVFITGKAGTGKSTFLNYFRKNTKKNVVVVAPTGVAAINVQGQTIHSFFRFKPGFMEPDKPKYARGEMRKLYRAIDVLVIDEISMVRADMFDAIQNFLRLNGKEPDAPFGGVQICIMGDLYQLPPVVTNNESEVYSMFYESPYFFHARCYKESDFQQVEFSKVFRQLDDNFIRFLNLVREKNMTQEAFDWFNRKTRFSGKKKKGAIVLTTTNRIADDTNRSELSKLDDSLSSYEGKAKGSFVKDTQKLPAPMDLELKVGAQVMFVKNDKDKRWVNGTIGEVVKLTDKLIKVKVGEDSFEVAKESWESIRFEYDKEKEKVVEAVIGSFEQYPIQLAWAVTIHKCQGKTFDDVIINLGSGAFASGQAYVALSRCRTLDGIKLVKPLKPSDVMVDDRIVRFMEEAV